MSFGFMSKHIFVILNLFKKKLIWFADLSAQWSAWLSCFV